MLRANTMPSTNYDIIANVLADVLFHRSALHIVSVEESQFTLTLPDADNDFLVRRSASGPAVSATADIGFVHFDNTIQLGLVGFHHRGADSVTEIPRGLVGLDSERPLHLTGAHALLSFAEQHSGKEPRHEGQVSIVENRARGNGELVLA